MNDQCRNTNLSNRTDGTGLVVIIVSAAKACRPRGESVVEIPNRANRLHVGDVIQLWKEAFLEINPVAHAAKKILVINPIRTPADGVGARGQVYGRRNGADAKHFGRRIATVFACQLENQIASERIANQTKPAQAVDAD